MAQSISPYLQWRRCKSKSVEGRGMSRSLSLFLSPKNSLIADG
jgi:hypothetical protein